MQQHGGGIPVRTRLRRLANKLGFGFHRVALGEKSGYFTIGETEKFYFRDITEGPHGITEEGRAQIRLALARTGNPVGRHRALTSV